MRVGDPSYAPVMPDETRKSTPRLALAVAGGSMVCVIVNQSAKLADDFELYSAIVLLLAVVVLTWVGIVVLKEWRAKH